MDDKQILANYQKLANETIPKLELKRPINIELDNYFHFGIDDDENITI